MSTILTPPQTMRRYPVGAECLEADAASFRVWAPSCGQVSVVFETGEAALDLSPEGNGYFSAARGGIMPGARYRLRLDGKESHPDPASRYQPQGCEGPSEVVDPARYAWKDTDWRGLSREGQVLYEMHVGTFTREGTWRAAAAALPWLAELGITAIELMPVGEFAGSFGWGYDVAYFFAPTRLYGSPDDMRAFVDTAHALGIGVILDVVYNHCATIGCPLSRFAGFYFSRRHKNDWGNALNFDGDHAAPVREFIKSNAAYWIREFHLDGYRLDATQTIYDASPTHILADITESARSAAGARGLLIVGENEPQHVRMLDRPSEGGAGIDALWNDDFHHSARVALTGRTEAYYIDYRGVPQEFVSAAKQGFLYQGQYYRWQKKRRGSPSRGRDATQLVTFLQNHDQVANSARGLRLHELTDAGRYRAATALLLLMPQTPMLFQGQEFASSAPFLYFADHAPREAEVVRKGRRDFLSQFPSIAAGGHAWLTDPSARETYERCKLDLAERETHAHAVALHRDLLALRRSDAVFRRQCPIDGAVLADEAFVLRYFGADDDRLLIVNFGRGFELTPCPEPLLAPPEGCEWTLRWSSEDVAYGGEGTPPTGETPSWPIPAQAALVFASASGRSGESKLPGQT